MKTGEEEEDILFESRGKMYRFVSGEWKEKGVGVVKILKHRGTNKTRILMRRDQVRVAVSGCGDVFHYLKFMCLFFTGCWLACSSVPVFSNFQDRIEFHFILHFIRSFLLNVHFLQAVLFFLHSWD